MAGIRIRCPLCRTWVRQNQLNEAPYMPLEFSTFSGLGKGKGFKWEKRVKASQALKLVILLGLKQRLESLIQSVNRALYGYEATARSVLETNVSSYSPSQIAMTLKSRLLQTDAGLKSGELLLSIFSRPSEKAVVLISRSSLNLSKSS